MNKYQKIVLIIGAIALVIVIFTTPEIFVVGKSAYESGYRPDFEKGIYWALGIIGATVLLTLAFKDKKDKKEEQKGGRKDG